MAGEIAMELSNVLLGLGNIGTGIGFSAAEKNKKEELTTKTKKLKDDATAAGTLYDTVYYKVSVNLNRLKKAIDHLPDEMLKAIEVNISKDLKESSAKEAIQTFAKMLGYTKQSVTLVANLIKVIVYLRYQKGRQGYVPLVEEDEFEMVPMGDGQERPAVRVEPSSLPNTPKIDKLMMGLNVASIVFGLAGLATTIGLGAWTLSELDEALSEVKTKQAQVDAFQTAMTKTLDEIIKAAELPTGDYSGLTALASTWRTMSEGMESYAKILYFAIKGYFEGKSDKDVKATVEAQSDPGKPFEKEGFALAKSLADGIKIQFENKKTDKEIIAYFANEYPNERFVLDEYFISSLRRA